MNTVGANVGAGVVGIGVGKLEGEAVGVGVGNGLGLNRERTARLQKFAFFKLLTIFGGIVFFSAVLKPIFNSICVLQLFQALQDLHTSTPLRTQNIN